MHVPQTRAVPRRVQLQRRVSARALEDAQARVPGAAGQGRGGEARRVCEHVAGTVRFASAPRAACSLTCRFHRGRRSAHQKRVGRSRADAALCAALLHLHSRVKQTQDVRLFFFLLLFPFSSSIFLFLILSLDFYLLVSPIISLNSFCPPRRLGQLYEAIARGDVHAVRAL